MTLLRPERVSVPVFPRAWIVVPILSCGFLIWCNIVRRQPAAYVSALVVDAALFADPLHRLLVMSRAFGLSLDPKLHDLALTLVPAELRERLR